jgi:hypothetical protein
MAGTLRLLSHRALVEVGVLALLTLVFGALFWGYDREEALAITTALFLNVYTPLRAVTAALSLLASAVQNSSWVGYIWDVTVLALCVGGYVTHFVIRPGVSWLTKPLAAAFGKDAGALARVSLQEIGKDVPLVAHIALVLLLAYLATFVVYQIWRAVRFAACGWCRRSPKQPA